MHGVHRFYPFNQFWKKDVSFRPNQLSLSPSKWKVQNHIQSWQPFMLPYSPWSTVTLLHLSLPLQLRYHLIFVHYVHLSCHPEEWLGIRSQQNVFFCWNNLRVATEAQGCSAQKFSSPFFRGIELRNDPPYQMLGKVISLAVSRW